MTKRRYIYLWCVLIIGIFLPVLPHGNGPIFHEIAGYASNRWVHFLAYAAVAAIPVTCFKLRPLAWLSILLAVASVVFRLLQAHTSGTFTSFINVPADLFGLAAGILFALNLRMMHNSKKSPDNADSAPFQRETF